MISTLYELDDQSEQLHRKYVNGLIRIQDSNGIVYNQEGNNYLNFKFVKNQNNFTKRNEQLRDIPKFMSTIWNMKSPKIIIIEI